jgi:type IV secretory pathway TraG/TraD family ATPase VirD4
MPEAQDGIVIKLPEDAVPQVVRSVLQYFDYRVGPAELRIMTASRVESGQVFRSKKFIKYEVTVEWRPLEEVDDEADPLDESSWPEVQIVVKVADRQNNWTGSKCIEELKKLLNGIPYQAEVFKEKLLALSKDNRFGNVRWASFDDLNRNGYLSAELQSDRFLIGRYKHGEQFYYMSVPPRLAERHGLICGPTGCGKTQTIFVPNLMERLDASAIVTEATPAGLLPDLLKLTAAYRAKHGHQIYYFNPADPRSHRINPVDAVKTVSDAQDLADIIIRNTTTNKHVGDQVWEISERQLLTALIMKVATEKGSLVDVRRALLMGRKELTQAMEMAPEGKAKQEALGMFKSTSEGFLNGVVVGLLVRLGPWLNPSVIALTSETNIDLSTLESSLFTFYLCVPAGARQVKPVASVILNFLIDRVLDQLSTRGQLQRPLMMLLDELTNFGMIPDLRDQMTIMRHAHVPFVLGMQDAEQLRAMYGHSDAKIMLAQPATRVFFKPNEIDTAREISAQLGQGTRVDLGKMSLYARKLMAPEEVLTLDSQRAICFLPEGPPVRLWKIMPGSYQHLAADPPLPEPIVVDESLVNEPKLDSSIVEAVQQEFPKLFEEPKTEAEEAKLLQNQNDAFNKNIGQFKRERARKIADKIKRDRGDEKIT